ncbi:acyl-CoA thioester hydrolase [Geothermobacter ehrlichii]|uniref:Acyl-CoA thioester hydrolase n=1 Tax=Geothermobacter ehrlichii TaxID=213224 RepID=A0A5D3WEU0_9BACT|nr:thioesterase family protein [Geothermobacter ehrlichii]TYO95798.1 acyl-CoA thioester hydrolase [Geothermobacter ehrlichii]
MSQLSTEIEIRFSDLDAYGHVNNATFFTYLETARVKFFRDRFAELMRSGILFLVAEATCRYLQPIGLDDRVLIDVWADKVGRRSFTLGYRMHDGNDKVFARAGTVMVCFDQKAGTPTALPDDFRNALTALTPQD